MHIDLLLAYYCAPTLSGLKPANLILHQTFSTQRSLVELEDARYALGLKGIELKQMWTCPERTLTFVFHRERLLSALEVPEVNAFLLKMGYAQNATLDEILNHLNTRMVQGEAFPHEVGIFLGYPLVDVLGFIEHKGQNCKYCGYWKVYGDVNDARRQFDAFTNVREWMVSRLQDGARLSEILQTAS